MLVKALVRDAQVRGEGDKQYGMVTLETTHPLQIIDFRLFNRDLKNGTFKSFKDAVGKTLEIPLQAEVYNGQLQFQFPFGEALSVPAAPAAQRPQG